MATYAIGDIQGCCDELQRLLDEIEFSAERDRLWLGGDLVNRGPKSLEVLELAFAHRHSLVAVLGNHDLHLLSRVAGIARSKKRDTLDAILESPRRDELVDWLRQCPLVHRDADTILVHGGILPEWDWKEVDRRARRVHAGLRSDDWKEFLRSLQQQQSEESETVAVLTGLRLIDAGRRPVFDFSGAPQDAPEGQTPWFAAPNRRLARETIVFGHWAALGHRMMPNLIALDSACVWGGKLTAVRLEDRQVFQVACTSSTASEPRP